MYKEDVVGKLAKTGAYLIDKTAISAVDTLENIFVDMPTQLAAGANKMLYGGLAGVAKLSGLEDVKAKMLEEGNKSSDAMMKIAQKNIVRDLAQEEKLDNLAAKNTYITDPNNSLAVGVANGVGQIGGQLLSGNVLGSIGIAPNLTPFAGTGKLSAIANGAVNMLPTAGANAFASGTNEAYDGNNLGAALAYGTGSGLLESGIEAISGGIGGTASEKVVSRLLDKKKIGGKVTRKVAGYIGDKLVDALGEGAEEVASELLNPLLQKATYNKDLDLLDTYKNEVPKNVGKAFTESFLSTLIFNAGKDSISKSTDTKTTDTINNFTDGTQYEMKSPDKTVREVEVDSLLSRLFTVSKEGIINNVDNYKEKHIIPKIEDSIATNINENKQVSVTSNINSLLNNNNGIITKKELENIVENINSKVTNKDHKIIIEYKT